MQGHRPRRATQKSPATPISPKGGSGTASISLSLLLHDVIDIASSSLRELDAVALASNDTVFMKRDTKVPPTFQRSCHSPTEYLRPFPGRPLGLGPCPQGAGPHLLQPPQ